MCLSQHFPFGMAAEVEHRRQPPLSLGGTIEIPDHVGPGETLEVNFLHHVVFAVQGTGDGGFQRRPRRQRREPEHLAPHFAAL